jgi:HEPN domain-containing protein
MNPLTREWVKKADGDYHAAGLLLRARKYPNYDAACFHAQQCAEKYMKAVLHESGRDVDRTHDLSALLNDLVTINPMWEGLREASGTLTDYAVRFRYPGRSADRSAAKSAVRACELIREILRPHLGLPRRIRGQPRKRRTTRRRR